MKSQQSIEIKGVNKEMNVIKEKNVNVFFDGEVKNPVAARINSLARGRKLTEAAQDWEVNYNTLRNYFVRENARPKRDTLEKISIAEGVSIEWLLTGQEAGEQSIAKNESEMSNTVVAGVSTPLVQLLLTLSDNEQTRLYKVLARKGVETILYLLDEDSIKLLQLPDSVKAGVLRLASKSDTAIREILSQVERDAPPESVADKKAV